MSWRCRQQWPEPGGRDKRWRKRSGGRFRGPACPAPRTTDFRDLLLHGRLSREKCQQLFFVQTDSWRAIEPFRQSPLFKEKHRRIDFHCISRRQHFRVILRQNKVHPLHSRVPLKYRQESCAKRAPGGIEEDNDAVPSLQPLDQIAVIIDQSAWSVRVHRTSRGQFPPKNFRQFASAFRMLPGMSRLHLSDAASLQFK